MLLMHNFFTLIKMTIKILINTIKIINLIYLQNIILLFLGINFYLINLNFGNKMVYRKYRIKNYMKQNGSQPKIVSAIDIYFYFKLIQVLIKLLNLNIK